MTGLGLSAVPLRFPRDVPRLEDGDVVLRAPRPDDVEGVVEQCNDPVSVRWTTVPLGYDASMARDFLTKTIPDGWESGRNHTFALECTHPDGGRRFGGSLSLEAHGEGRWEVAFGAHPGARGRGLTTTAVRLLLDHAFDTLQARTVVWWAHTGNWASRRIAWRTGFAIADGVVPGWLPQRGVLNDAWVGTLLAGDRREPRSPWLDAVPLSDGVVRLRPMLERDLDRLAETCDSPDAQRHLRFLPSPYKREHAEGLLERSREAAAQGRAVWWTVVAADAAPGDDPMLATVCLPQSDDTGGELGYWAHPDARGRGVATRAAQLALDHAFARDADGGLGWARAWVRIHPGNDRSLDVARRLGFTPSGLMRAEGNDRDGGQADAVRLDLLAGEHRA